MTNFPTKKTKEKIKYIDEILNSFPSQMSERQKTWIIGKMNQIANLAHNSALESIEDELVKEIVIAHKEETPTSRLTSLAMTIKKLKE